MICIATNILSPLSNGEILYLPDGYISFQDGRITAISPSPNCSNWLDKRDCICIPGLIDSHVHLSQLDIRGRYAPSLLDWLDKYTFPAEKKSQSMQYSRQIAKRFYETCLSKGTTTSVVYTSPYKSACDISFGVAQEMGVRSIIGMTMMDTNCPDYLKQTTHNALQSSYELWEKWHDNDLLDYIFSPRFAVTCSAELLKETGKLVKNLAARLQSHLSENSEEITRVLEIFPDCQSYTEIYNKSGILGERSIMGHAIHLSPAEINILRETDSRIAFCPDSNLFLKSGHFSWQAISESGIKVGLASDVGAGTDLSMLKMMKFADYVLDKTGISPGKAFYLATLANAEILGLENKIGSLEAGKEADLVFISYPEVLENDMDKNEILSKIIYLNHEMVIDSTWIQGKELYKKNKSGGSNEIS
jgi:guanine deaminase